MLALTGATTQITLGIIQVAFQHIAFYGISSDYLVVTQMPALYTILKPCQYLLNDLLN